MPKKVKKKREIKRDDGTNEGWEEYYEYIYPDEQTSAPSKVWRCNVWHVVWAYELSEVTCIICSMILLILAL